MNKLFLTCLLSLALAACATNPATQSELAQGKRYFDQGYYKRSMQTLLPLACDGNAEAEYAVGYMYYYGYGVAQDTDVGYFWINRSAQKGFAPAKEAIHTMGEEKNKMIRPTLLKDGS
jgi:TPR repeat protein